MPEANDTNPPEELFAEIDCSPDDEPIDTFIWSGGGKTKFFLGMAALLAFGLAMFALVLWAALTQAKEPGTKFAALAGSALVLGLFLWVAWGWIRHYHASADRVILYEQGLVWHSVGGGWEAGRWADVVKFFRRETTGEGETASRCSVEFDDGTKVTFAAQLQGYHSLAEHSQRFVHRTLFPVYKARYDAGKSVEFGRLVLTRTKLVAKAGGGYLGWWCHLVHITEAEVARGGLWLNHITNRLEGFVADLGDIPNYSVLFALFPFDVQGWQKDAFDE